MNKTQEFINKAKLIHGGIYNYSKVEYTKSCNKVIIICKKHNEFLQSPNKHLQKRNCPKCSGNQKSSTEEFIKKAIKIHSDKYDYSKVNYISRHKKVIIICKEHGEFEQEAGSHLSGCACKECGIINIIKNKTHTFEKFINKAILVHGDKYKYSQKNYNNKKEKIKIKCKMHNEEFEQTPQAHLAGQGCSKCSKKYKMNEVEFIDECKIVHGDKYDYSKVSYVKKLEKIIIFCKIHGKFEQLAYSHIKGQGCIYCSGNYKSNTEEFIKKAIKIHNNKYDYSKVDYYTAINNVIIICKEHGEFKQTPNTHLNGSGCQKCYSNFSKMQIQWLELLSKLYNINIQHSLNTGEFKINNTRYKADGYCKETNTIYEFHGDFWHGNPKIYKPEELNDCSKKTYGELYQKTLEKEQKIKELGYNLKVMWESDWNKINKSIKKLQKKFKTCKDLNLLV